MPAAGQEQASQKPKLLDPERPEKATRTLKKLNKKRDPPGAIKNDLKIRGHFLTSHIIR